MLCLLDWILCHRVDIGEAKRFMPAVQYSHNTTRSLSYGNTPLETMTRLKARSPMKMMAMTGSRIRSEEVNYINAETLKRVKNELLQVNKALDVMHYPLIDKKMKRREQQRKAKLAKYSDAPRMLDAEIGDWVLCALPERTKAHKLFFRWHGPYIVKDVVQGTVIPRYSSGEDAVNTHTWLYEVHLQGRPNRTETMHTSRMKKFAGKDVGMPADVIEQSYHDLRIYDIDNILEYRVVKDTLELKVQWMGFREEEAVWMDAEELRYIDPEKVFTYVRLYHDLNVKLEDLWQLMLDDKAAQRRDREQKRRDKERAKATAKDAK